MEAVASLASHCCSQPACLQVPHIKESLQDYLRVHMCIAHNSVCNVPHVLFSTAAVRVYAE